MNEKKSPRYGVVDGRLQGDRQVVEDRRLSPHSRECPGEPRYILRRRVQVRRDADGGAAGRNVDAVDSQRGGDFLCALATDVSPRKCRDRTDCGVG